MSPSACQFLRLELSGTHSSAGDLRITRDGSRDHASSLMPNPVQSDFFRGHVSRLRFSLTPLLPLNNSVHFDCLDSAAIFNDASISARKHESANESRVGSLVLVDNQFQAQSTCIRRQRRNP